MNDLQSACRRRAGGRRVRGRFAPERQQVLNGRDLHLGGNVLAEGLDVRGPGRRQLLVELLQGVVSGPCAETPDFAARIRLAGCPARRAFARRIEAEGVVGDAARAQRKAFRSEEHTSELQSQSNLVCRLLLEKKKKKN